MVLKVELCSDNDMLRVFEITSKAFELNEPYFNALNPAHDTIDGRIHGASRMLNTKQTDPNTTFLKVVDTVSGTIIALSKWIIYKDTIPPETELSGDYWENDEEKEFAQHLHREFMIPRRKAIKESEGNLLVLDILVVDPAYQRRGAGRLLVKWGTAVADELGVTAVVEASEKGSGLYETEGFKFIEHWETTMPEKWKHREVHSFDWMVRPPTQ